MIINNMKKANAVLATIESFIDGEQSIYLEPYQNGREHGWSLQQDNLKVCFSEYRNTDDIVVYYGKILDFSMQGNTPNDNTYDNKKFFRYNQIIEASQFVIDYLGLK